MRRVCIAVVAAGFFALSLRAEETPTDVYRKAMRDAGDALRAARAAGKEIEDSGAGAQDYMPFEAATATMKTSFATTLAYWQEKKVDDAVKLAGDAAKLVGELEDADTAIRAGNDETAAREFDVHGRRFQHVGRDLLALLDQLVTRLEKGLAADQGRL